MASKARRLILAALFIASLIGVVAAVHFRRTPQPVAVKPPVSAAPSVAPAPSVERVVQLRGRILAASGDPVASAHVRVITQAHVVFERETDSAGQFSFDGLPTARVRVEADHDPEGAVRSAEISVSDLTTEITLVLAPAGIRGVVVDGEDGHAIDGASLSVEGVPFAVASVPSDAAGAFRFSVVPFESTAIVAVASGYRASRVTLGPREDQPEPSLRIVLRAAPPIEGDVTDQDGKPLHAHVIACEGQPFEARVESADDGTFRLPPSSVGCDAFATHDDMSPSDAVPIVDGRHVTLRLGAGGVIAGFAVDDRGAFIDTFSVGVESFIPLRGDNAPRGGATAFKNGAFRLERLVPGTYVLTASTAGRPPARSSPVVVRSGAVTDNIKIVIFPGGVVEGNVFDDQHAPLADVELRFDLVSVVAQSDATATTDASGHYRLEGAPPGLFTVSTHKDGYRTKLVSGLSVTSGNTIAKDITLTKGNGLELAGIGATLAPAGNGIALAGVLAGDPADRIGLQVGDRIVRIDGEEIAGLSLVDAIQRLRGEPGAVVGLTIERGGVTLDFTITRGVLMR